MKEIRIHGRGGEGAVTFAHTLGLAANYGGKFGQSCQGMTPLRRGAPIEGYARIDEREIVERGLVSSPDFVVVLNANVLKGTNVELGMKDEGRILANATEPLPFQHDADHFDATTLALEIIGSAVPNSVMLGAFAAWSGLVSLEDIIRAAPEIMGPKISAGLAKSGLSPSPEPACFGCVLSDKGAALDAASASCSKASPVGLTVIPRPSPDTLPCPC